MEKAIIFETLEMICWFISREKNVLNFTKVIYGQGSWSFIEICRPWFLVIYKVTSLKGLSWLASSLLFVYNANMYNTSLFLLWNLRNYLWASCQTNMFPKHSSRTPVTRLTLKRNEEQFEWAGNFSYPGIEVNFSEIVIREWKYCSS